MVHSKLDHLLAAMWLNLVAALVVGFLWGVLHSASAACTVAAIAYIAVLWLFFHALAEDQ